MTTHTLNSWEANYLIGILEAQEPNLFTSKLIAKLRCAEEMAVAYYDGEMTPPVGFSSRRSDPETSRQAGNSVAFRAGSQKHSLLEQYLTASDGLTDEEAGIASGLAFRNKCCYWKRCSELRKAGLIAVTGETRLSSAEENQQVCVITDKGRRLFLKTFANT